MGRMSLLSDGAGDGKLVGDPSKPSPPSVKEIPKWTLSPFITKLSQRQGMSLLANYLTLKLQIQILFDIENGIMDPQKSLYCERG